MQTSFNGGELSPFMLGRPDHAAWGVSTAAMVGWVPRSQGPAEACPGFEFIGATPGPCRLLPFEPYVTQGYVIETGNYLLRFYTNDVLLTKDGLPVTVPTPWSYAQVLELDYEQSNDVIYMFHGDVRTRLLTRDAADAFSLEEVTFEDGPFLDRNDDEDFTISFDGVTGTVTATASAPLFAPTDVGRLIEVEANDLSDIPAWEPGITVTAGQLVQWDGRVYQVQGGRDRTGSVAPVHVRGVEWDGIGAGVDLNDKQAGGVELLFLHDMFGRVRITGYTSPTVVTAEVTRRLPLQLAMEYDLNEYRPPWWSPGSGLGGTWTTPGDGSYDAGTWRWRLGAFSDTTGYPTHGVIWNQRLLLAKDDRLYGSVAGDLLNFDRLNDYGEVSRDQAFTLQIDNPNPIQWLLASDELFIGTSVNEYVLRPASNAEGIGPGNLKIARQSSRGSAALRPIDLGGKPIFLQRNRRKLLALVEDTYGRFGNEDLTRYADHIGNSPFVELCWQREPLQLVWTVRADGSLAGANYMPDEQVLGWFRRPLAAGLFARSITSVTSPDGRRDQLWCAVERADGWSIMQLAPWALAGEVPDNPVMCDAALTYAGASIDTISLPHLANAMVEVVGDGAWLGTFQADGYGTVTLPRSVRKAMAGLAFPAYIDLLPPEAGGDNGPAQGRMKRGSRLGLRLQNSLGLQIIGPSGHKTDVENTYPTTDLTAAIPPITRDEFLDIVGTWDRAGQVRIARVAPFPSTLLAAFTPIETSQR